MVTNVAAVIVNWNKKVEVLDLLYALKKITEPLFDIFVVDNASTDGSVNAIENYFPEVNLILKKKNLGGTGGFNAGIDYVNKFQRYNYIWLLDNDVKVKNDTLLELYKTMESDRKIGLAGSRIVDIDNNEMTVEAGSNFRWDIIGVVPVQQNVKKLKSNNDTICVDYVAICSALVSVKAIKQVGLMDDRLFLFWDDMDWGLSFNENGFKVVAVVKSVAFHGSFSERNRGDITNFYYGVRNSFLVYSKHTSFLKHLCLFYRSLRNCYHNYYILKTINRRYAAKLITTAISDYINNRWGKFSQPPMIQESKQLKEFALEKENIKIRKILVSLLSTSFSESEKMLESIKKLYPNSEITLLVHDYRASYYDNYQVYILDKKKMHNLWYVLRKFINIIMKKFDLLVYITPSPFIGAVRRSIAINSEGKVISKIRCGYFVLPKQFLALILAEIRSFIVFPFIIYRSIKYKKNKVNNKTYQ